MSEEVHVLKVALLDGFTDAVEKNQGIGLREVGVGVILIVETQNSTYTIHVINPLTREVRVTGGTCFSDSETCKLSGATLGGAHIGRSEFDYGVDRPWYVHGIP